FFAPALLWLGSALLLLRLRGRFLAWLAERAGGGRASTWRGFLLASAGRRGAAINRGLLVAGLLLAFGVNLGLFAATYDQQARVDAQLTLGADVVATAPPRAIRQHALEHRVARMSGVAGTGGGDHSYACVGPDLQDVLGVRSLLVVRPRSPPSPPHASTATKLHSLERTTHHPGPNVLVAKTTGDPVGVAQRLAAATRSQGTLVKNIRQQTAQTVSSITTVDL